jgi:hypothetical protein
MNDYIFVPQSYYDCFLKQLDYHQKWYQDLFSPAGLAMLFNLK